MAGDNPGRRKKKITDWVESWSDPGIDSPRQHMSVIKDSVSKPPQLISVELRVIGSLMEKELTTPDQYPLTLNSLITACNQKSSRDPVSNYHQGEIIRTLQELQHRALVSKEHGSRADKFSQQFIRRLELGKKHQALLCVMMLRGPQTVSELNTRTQRMVEFTDRGEIEHLLDRLCNRETPYVVRLAQQAGQRGERFMHLFSGMPDSAVSARTAAEALDTATTAAPAATESSDTHSAAPGVATRPEQGVHDGGTRTATGADVATLTKELARLRHQLAHLYRLTGHELPEAGESDEQTQ